VLPEGLIDQIAAGEVVERPASVVKELVENAIDAEAGHIRIEVRQGGRALVAVSDDGCGMTPADARLALERHATSKIAAAEDLQRIASYGFRGEALPSIAAVSRLRLRTRARGAAEGLELRVEGGRRFEARAASAAQGTRVEVAELFFNVPARRKFLKTSATEWGHVADWLARVALALPDVHFDLHRDDRPALHWPAVGDVLDRIAAVLSEQDAAALVPVRADTGKLVLHGFVSSPQAHRANGAGIYLYVNRRPVRDRLLRHALLEAYRDVLPRSRFPSAVLFLDLPPEQVDANVHPAKWEVRFADPTAVHRLVAGAARQAFGQRRWLGTAREPARGPSEPSRSGSERGGAWAQALPSDWVLAGRPGPSTEPDLNLEGSAVREVPEPGRGLRFQELRLLGQLLATYLVLESPDGLVLVDQHAAHERVLFERLRERWREGKVERQALLVPETLELAPARAARLAAASGALERLGFELEPFGESALVVRALPMLLAGREPRKLAETLADELEAGESERILRGDLEAAELVFASLACHAARRMGERLEEEEQRALLEALDEIPWAPTCPHGRPVALAIGLAEIERRFARR
jgi:DNA mismatch repair protein MutL